MSPTTSICDICRPLHFDEKALGGKPVISDDGRQAAQFPFSQHTPGELYSGSIEDSFPNLPNISASSRGCAFCKFLLDVLRSGDVTAAVGDMFGELDNDIQFDLNADYLWHHLGRSPNRGSDELLIAGRDIGLRQLRFFIWLEVESATLDFDWNPGDIRQIDIFCSISSLPNADCDDKVVAWLGLEARTDQGFSSTHALGWMETALSNCLNDPEAHEACIRNASAAKPYLPTRLIDVSDSSGQLRLVNSADIRRELPRNTQLPPYTALSYCWGRSAPFKTESGNLSEKMQGFALSDLPKTIQDAVLVTRHFSIPYLWVDALCILQDVDADWVHESNELMYIYGSAYFTICSATASSSISFLNPEQPTIEVPFQSSINPEITGGWALSYIKTEPYDIGWDTYASEPSIQSTRWVSRGWTYLELLASRRAFRIRLPELEFACLSCEHSRGGAPRKPENVRIHELPAQPKELHRSWINIINMYVDRIFSVPQDVLPALSSIARVFGEKLSDEYHAGIWKSEIMLGLAWYVRTRIFPGRERLNHLLERLKSPQRSHNYIAPSWSWAGRRHIEIGVALGGGRRFLQCQTAISTTLYDDTDPYGKVTKGELVIIGRCQTIGPRTPFRVVTDFLKIDELDVREEKIRCQLDFTVDQDFLYGNFKLILLGQYESQRTDEELPFTAFGLVLHESGEQGSYFRVGFFETLLQKSCGIHELFRNAGDETVVVI